ncbi:6-phosphogluconate dehydrogenase NAD-binding protein [Ferrimonas balearica DSM 9799]|uniref:6-phosphogluconate dehydrogenase NAD-binding protein n=1 Tax=Ferrimonas balearica (strain DSM 9799 / CCM 4581 / KCTC 23876 / PAT) TaxID=550540 RepID=E1SMR5_FERBD|nr:NAD(P)-dependent oxidoreductase [Ferrimonas balearica]ADN75604.1 6-phosphogluconate dehydrogenase NAD-binding protein [Ferrimonas balearica DSM 9799]MBY6105564.1 NAD(P)-dependent oxidoreductase [Ferrimonas balearica]MBY6223900.1 NAD(P)-dependent oxidoreductase [Ferrimonas balearica]
MSQVAFIGLGVMGYPMAGHLQANGHDVCVYNRTTAKAQAWSEQHGGRWAETPAKAAEGAELVMVCVGNDDDLRSVVLGPDGVLAGMAPGAILVDHTTASADVARELAEAAAAQGKGFLDAPVSGGQAGAENGVLTVMLGGDEAQFAQAKPVIDSYARSAVLMGPVGSGQLCKMVNQICIAGVVQGLAEGLHFAQQAGLDGERVVDVISKGAAQSWQMENRSGTMLQDQFEFGFAVDWMRKDLDIALTEARRNGAQLPLTALVDQFYAEVQKLGGGRWDTSSLMTRLKR